MTVVSGDLRAAIDVVDQLAERSDSLRVDEAVEALEALAQLGNAVKQAMVLIESGAANQLEQPRVIGNRRYVKANRYTRRFNHERIAKMIAVQASINNITGEIASAVKAAETATYLMREIYVSHSTDAKMGALRALLGVGDPFAENLARNEHTGTKVEVYDLKEKQ